MLAFVWISIYHDSWQTRLSCIKCMTYTGYSIYVCMALYAKCSAILELDDLSTLSSRLLVHFLINFGFSSSRSQVIRVYSLKSIPSVIRQNDTKEKKVTENVQIATFGLKQKLSHWLRNRSDVQTIFLITYDCILYRGNWFCLWLKLRLKRSWTIRFIVSLSFNRVLCWAC